jgi:tRNA dimethylallyltransferase
LERQVIVIVGPTCSGKTALGIKVAKQLNTEIISADSRQIYKYLDIGTAKPTPEELNQAKHHFINYLEPDEYYNVHMFEKAALEVIENLLGDGKVPIVVGGSGLYIRAIVDGIFDDEVNSEDYRDQLHEWRKKFGNEYLYQKLKEVDPHSAGKMLPQNWKRVMRALEVYYSTGEPIWKFHQKHERNLNIEFKQFGLNWEREILYSRIEKRVDEMIDAGLVGEVKRLLNKYSSNLNALNTVGYKEIIDYLNDNISLERAVELIKRNTRRFAKRQLTWFRKDDRIKWFDMRSPEDIETAAEKILNEISAN